MPRHKIIITDNLSSQQQQSTRAWLCHGGRAAHPVPKGAC